MVVLSALAAPATIQIAAKAGAIKYFVNLVDLSVIEPSSQARVACTCGVKQTDQDRWSLMEAVHGNRSIGTAVGMMVERHQLTPDGAFEALRGHARNERLTFPRYRKNRGRFGQIATAASKDRRSAQRHRSAVRRITRVPGASVAPPDAHIHAAYKKSGSSYPSSDPSI